MINAKGLQFGNLMLLENQVVELTEIGETCLVKGELVSDYFHINDISPIPLTEEWLIRAGFKKVNDKYAFDPNSYHFEHPKCWVYLLEGYFEIELITNKESDRFNLMKQFRFVHQLQNVIYSVFLEELEFTEDI